MKALFLAVSLLFTASAFAQSVDLVEQVEFKAFSECDGCARVGEFLVYSSSTFPVIDGKEVKSFRLYYAQKDFDSVTKQSPYYEFDLEIGEASVYVPAVRIGNLESGKEYFFKLAPVDKDGEVIYFLEDTAKDQRFGKNSDYSVVVK